MNFSTILKTTATTFVPGLAALLAGFLGHLLFYPVIERWTNSRNRKLARPAIGVMINAPQFVIMRSIFRRATDEDDGHQALDDLSAYLMSFLWSAAGVIMGYIFDDWRRDQHGEF